MECLSRNGGPEEKVRYTRIPVNVFLKAMMALQVPMNAYKEPHRLLIPLLWGTGEVGIKQECDRHGLSQQPCKLRIIRVSL